MIFTEQERLCSQMREKADYNPRWKSCSKIFYGTYRGVKEYESYTELSDMLDAQFFYFPLSIGIDGSEDQRTEL